jgi:methylated-DNA-[protein]-cysteine S-methyltransferase
MTTPQTPPTLTAVVAATALGFAGVALSDRGIRYATLFHRSRSAATGELESYGAVAGPDDRAEAIVDLLQSYALGRGDALESFPVDAPRGEPFQHAVWRTLREIPCGETRSYGWVARRVGEPQASRAVGAAVGANPIPLWLPCHRVVGSDGSLTGFGGGLEMKRTLLELEGALPRSLFVAPSTEAEGGGNSR